MLRLFALLFCFAICWGDAMRVCVVGGTGFVGSRVCKALVEMDAEVTSLSKTGRVPAWAADAAWTKAVKWKALDLLSADAAAVDAAMGSPVGVVSCLGVVSPDVEALKAGNGAANEAAFASAGRTGVKRCVYVSVAEEVMACEDGWLPFAKDEFSAYFAGKRAAEQAAADAIRPRDVTRLCIVKPTFIYGGEKFEIPLPGKFVAPRVSAAYGAAVEELLSVDFVQSLADALPGLIKVALRPPVSVEAVARTCALGALGSLTSGAATRRAVGTLDGTAAIRAAAGEPTPTGLADGLVRALTDLGERSWDVIEEYQKKAKSALKDAKSKLDDK